jgi:hypothetical protein
MARTSCIQWNDDDVRFVLDQHTELDCYSASSLKQQSASRNVAPRGHIILIRANQSFKQTNELMVFVGDQNKYIIKSYTIF